MDLFAGPAARNEVIKGAGIERHSGKSVPVTYSPEGAIMLTALPWEASGQTDWHPPKPKRCDLFDGESAFSMASVGTTVHP